METISVCISASTELYTWRAWLRGRALEEDGHGPVTVPEDGCKI